MPGYLPPHPRAAQCRWLAPLGGVCLAALLAFEACAAPAGSPRFVAKYGSLEKHELPAWFDDAKLGIFIHWGIYAVPAWAPPSGQFGKLPETEFFKRNPYAEWYFNSMRIEGSPTHAYHLDTYGADFDYYRFGQTFNREVERWDPAAMAELFRSVHARYVVLTTKHHDGFTLWPSAVKNPHHPDAHATRDIVGELTAAVTARGLKMGFYYSGGIDWSFRPVLIDGTQEGGQVTPEGDYAAYADAHWRELIERYRPALLWNDIRYPEKSGLLQIVADFYNANPEGAINNRWGRWMTHDFTTAEYQVHPGIVAKKWEATRGIGNSFGYNRTEGAEHMLSVDELVDSFIDIVSKNGNLLLNVGPRADGSIPGLQLERLRGLGRWLDVNGDAIFGTRPWVDFAGTLQGSDAPVRFTYRPGRDSAVAGDVVYALLLRKPAGARIVLEGVVPAGAKTEVRLLGHDRPLAFRRVGDAMEIELPPSLPDAPAYALAISPQPGRILRK
ncbi:MAG TPA: alpha-L-fucosidase [Opitutaceae bacterium]